MRRLLPILAAALMALAACGDTDSTSSIREENAAPEINADPTPDTGTGGTSQTTSPDATVNSAPGQPEPVE